MLAIDLNSPWPYLATAVVVGLMGFYAWRQPRRPGTRAFSWMVAVWLVWALVAALVTQTHSLGQSYSLWIVQVFCALAITSLELFFSLEYTGNDQYIAAPWLYLSVLPAVIFSGMLIFLPTSALISLVQRSGRMLVMANPVMISGLALVISAIWLTGLVVLVGRFARAPAFRIPILLIILGQTAIHIGALAASLFSMAVRPVQVIILISNITAFTYFIALYAYRILRVAPVARDQAIQGMPLALLVLDVENRLVDFNPAAQALPGLAGKLALNQAAGQILGEWWPQISPLVGRPAGTVDVQVPANTEPRDYLVHSQPIVQASGWRIGQEFLLQDVTQARQAQRQQAQTLWAQATLEERVQLADELHDGLSQDLAFLNLQSQTALVYLNAGQTAAAQASLARLSEAAGEIQEDTRALIGDLLTFSLPAENFCAALRQALARFADQTGLAACLEITGGSGEIDPGASFCSPDRLPPAAALQLLRITQEALTNVRKHAGGASRVQVWLRAEDSLVRLTISDDGAGFDPSTLRQNGKHFGLQVMRQRAERIGGGVEVFPNLGQGARVEVWAPLLQPGEAATPGGRLPGERSSTG